MAKPAASPGGTNPARPRAWAEARAHRRSRGQGRRRRWHSPFNHTAQRSAPVARRAQLPAVSPPSAREGDLRPRIGVAHRRRVVPSCSGADGPEDRVAERAVGLLGWSDWPAAGSPRSQGAGAARGRSADANPVATCARACAERSQRRVRPGPGPAHASFLRRLQPEAQRPAMCALAFLT